MTSTKIGILIVLKFTICVHIYLVLVDDHDCAEHGWPQQLPMWHRDEGTGLLKESRAQVHPTQMSQNMLDHISQVLQEPLLITPVATYPKPRINREQINPVPSVWQDLAIIKETIAEGKVSVKAVQTRAGSMFMSRHLSCDGKLKLEVVKSLICQKPVLRRLEKFHGGVKFRDKLRKKRGWHVCITI